MDSDIRVLEYSHMSGFSMMSDDSWDHPAERIKELCLKKIPGGTDLLESYEAISPGAGHPYIALVKCQASFLVVKCQSFEAYIQFMRKYGAVAGVLDKLLNIELMRTPRFKRIAC